VVGERAAGRQRAAGSLRCQEPAVAAAAPELEQHRRRREPGRGWTEAARRRKAEESRGGGRGRRRAGAGVRHGWRGGSWEGGADEGGPVRLLPSRAEREQGPRPPRVPGPARHG